MRTFRLRGVRTACMRDGPTSVRGASCAQVGVKPGRTAPPFRRPSVKGCFCVLDSIGAPWRISSCRTHTGRQEDRQVGLGLGLLALVGEAKAELSWPKPNGGRAAAGGSGGGARRRRGQHGQSERGPQDSLQGNILLALLSLPSSILPSSRPVSSKAVCKQSPKQDDYC